MTPIRRDVNICRPGLAGKTGRQAADGLQRPELPAVGIKGQHIQASVELIEQVDEPPARRKAKMPRTRSRAGDPICRRFGAELAAGRIELEIHQPATPQAGDEHMPVRRSGKNRMCVGAGAKGLLHCADPPVRPDGADRDLVAGVGGSKQKPAAAVG